LDRGIRIRVTTSIASPRDRVWADVSNLASHVEWMLEAQTITFTSVTTAGVGAAFDCATRVGPIRLVDRMQITAWRAPDLIGVEHVGLVRGDGRFVLEAVGPARTQFTWDEVLTMPWWLGGPLAKPVVWLIWRLNLRSLRRRFDA
jgi:hypothetical protein